jgi:hypothetical protein
VRAWAPQWEQEDVRFDLRHQALVSGDWRSSRRGCTIEAGLYLPSQRRPHVAPGIPTGLGLRAGDLVRAADVEFGAGRLTASVTLVVIRERARVGSGFAHFWRQRTLPGPRDLSDKLAGRIRSEAAVDEYGDALPMDPAMGLRLRDLEYAEQTRSLALAAGLPANVAQLLQDAWAHLAYQEGLRDAASAPAVSERTTRLDKGRNSQRAKGEPDRRLARQIIWQAQSAGQAIDLRTCAKATLARWKEISAENPDDQVAAKAVEKGVAGIERTIGKLFADKDAKHRRLAYPLNEDPEPQLGQK